MLAAVLVAAYLALGVSAATDTAVLDRIGKGSTAHAAAPPASEAFFSGYDIAAGDGLLASATPTHLAGVQTVAASPEEITVATHRTRGRHPENFSPAQVTVDDAASPAEGESFVTLATDFTLAPGPASLAATPGSSFEDGQTSPFHPVGTGGDFFGPAQNLLPAADLAAGPAGGWTLPEPDSGR